jgi:hypothetical protein
VRSLRSTDLVLDECCKGEKIEEIGEVPPDVGVPVLPQALVVKTVDLSDLTRLVVASEDGYTIAISQLHRDEEGDGFDGIVSSVYVITHEEVVGIG